MTKWKGEAASYAPNAAQLVATVARAWSARLLPVALLMGLAAGSASGADRYWDPNGTAPGRGGTGTWNTTGLFWSPNNDGTSGPYTFWSNGGLDDAIFGDATTGSGFVGTVTLGAPITVHNMTFEDDTLTPFVETAYTITGSTLTLGGVTPTINVIGTATDIVTIDSIVAGTAGLTKTGGGILALTGANTFSGTITVNAGRLSVNGDGALGNAANGLTMGAGTGLLSTGALSATRVVTVSGQVDVLDTLVAANGVGSARFTGTGGLNIGNNVRMTNDANDYTGPTVFSPTNYATSNYYFSSMANLGVASSLGAPVTAANGLITVNSAGNSAGLAHYTGDGDSSNRNWQLNTSGFGRPAIINDGSGTLTLTGTIAANVGATFWPPASAPGAMC